MSRRSVEFSVAIDAPVDRVWSLMIDFDDYPRWNPFVVQARAPEGVAIGAPLHLRVRFPNGMRGRPRERITELRPPDSGGALLAYRFVGMPAAILRVERRQELTPLDSGRCRYTTREFFTGALRHLVPLGQIEEGTRWQADALKWAAEAP